MHAILIYDTWYGGTRKVADEIARGLAETLHIDPAVVEVEHAYVGTARASDLVAIGTPNHFGGPTRKIRHFVRDLGAEGSIDAAVAVFDTCFAGEAGKAAAKLGRLLGSVQRPGAPAPPALSVQVDGTRGPLHEGELVRAHAFGVALGRALEAADLPFPTWRTLEPARATVNPA